VVLRLRKYTQLSDNWAYENYSGPDGGRRLIASVGPVYYRPRRWRSGLHTSGEVWYLRLPCFNCFLKGCSKSGTVVYGKCLQLVLSDHNYPRQRLSVCLSVCLSVYLFIRTVSEELMQLGSSNLTSKCSTMSPRNPFILGLKGQRSRSRVIKPVPAWVIALT